MGLNSISDAAVEFVKSTVGKVVGSLTDKYLPSTMSEKEKEDLKLKAQELVIEELKASTDLEKVFAEDRRSAREREIAVKDKTPMVLAFFSFTGFFVILLLLMQIDIPERAHDSLMIMLGLLGAMVTGVTTYYFGSSSGSAAKTTAMNKIIGRKGD